MTAALTVHYDSPLVRCEAHGLTAHYADFGRGPVVHTATSEPCDSSPPTRSRESELVAAERVHGSPGDHWTH